MDRLPTIALGSSGLRVSRMAYGCWRIAGTWEPANVTPEKEAAARQAVLTAYDCGYTFFDLADIYCHGVCERLFGQVLKANPSLRDQIVVATKCGIRFKGDPAAESPYRYDSSADHIVRCCEESLRRLGLATIDLFMLHRPDYLMAPEEVASAFTRLIEQGKVRAVGVSNFRPWQVTMLQKFCSMRLVVNQVEMHLMRLDPFEDGTLDQCMAEKMIPMAWSPLAGGRLVDPNPIDLHTPDHAHRIHVREVMDQVAREHNASRTAIALAWLLKHPSGIVPVIGSAKPERIREAVQALSISLSRDQWYRLTEVSYGQRLP
jgi:predicted oxidoreductase